MAERETWEGVRSFTVTMEEGSLQDPLFRKIFFQEPPPIGPDIIKVRNSQEKRCCFLYPLGNDAVVAMVGKEGIPIYINPGVGNHAALMEEIKERNAVLGLPVIDALIQEIERSPWVKVNANLQENLLGKTSREIYQIIRNSPEFKHFLQDVPPGEDGEVEIVAKKIGLDFSYGQRKALFAIQKLFSATQYRGTETPDIIHDTSTDYRGPLPRMQTTKVAFFDAFGVPKRKSGRGWMEYDRAERDLAWKHLLELTAPVKMLYYIPDGKGGAKKAMRIQAPLIFLLDVETWERLNPQDTNKLEAGDDALAKGDNRLFIQLNIPLMLGLDNYFILLPKNHLQDLPKRSKKYLPTFIDLLYITATKRAYNTRGPVQDIVLEIGLKSLAERLRMQSLLKRGRPSAIKKKILDICEKSQELGYLKSYEITWGASIKEEKLVAVINKDKVLPETLAARNRTDSQ